MTRPPRTDPEWRRDVGESPLSQTTWRLFVALKLPEPAIEEIGTFINAMPAEASENVRWTPRENVHLTLLFLGDTSTELVPQIQDRMNEAAANSSSFTLRLGEAGAFPSYRSPKILWVGLSGEVQKLVLLQGRIEGSMRTVGFEPERRPFRPHITVGRTARNLTGKQAGDVGFSWRRSELPEQRAVVPVSEIHLLRSHLSEGGAKYETVFSCPVGAS